MRPLSIFLSLACLTGCGEFPSFDYYGEGEYPFELRESPAESETKTLKRRDLSSIHHDEALTYKAMKKLSKLNRDGNRVKVTVLNGHVLVTGVVKNNQSRHNINSLLQEINGTTKVSNNTRVSSITKSQNKSDNWIKTKVRANLIKEKSLNSSNIKISSENGTIFLMGTGSSSDVSKATQAAKSVEGVSSVVNLMDPS
ncbi:MAG TPA: BON domain-containing protein [Gammaproteobacteria bacterium]|nr:BON domain-containing protein [Gammaproteobacteria bacterium]